MLGPYDLLSRVQSEYGVVSFTEVFPRESFSPLPTALSTDPACTNVVDSYSKSLEKQVPFNLKCFFGSDIVVTSTGFLWAKSKMLIEEDLMPRYWRREIHNARYFDHARDAALPLKVVEAPCICAVGWGVDNYGHFTIEALPRLLLARHLLRRTAPDLRFKVLFRQDMPEKLRAIARQALGLAEEDCVIFDHLSERVCLKNGIFPSYTYRGDGFHPQTAGLLDTFLPQNIATDRGQPVYISRQAFADQGLSKRNCLNEDQLARIASEEFGFKIIYPETLSWEDQVRIFREASVVVGLYGSGLHTAIFADKGLKLGVIGLINAAQSHIAALRGQAMAYQTNGFELGGTYTVPDDGFRRMLAHMTSKSAINTTL